MRRRIKGKSISGIRIGRGCSGLTITELAIALVVLVVLITISIHIYTNYISKARVTVANSVLDNAGKTFLSYQMDKGRYPASIDFTSCVDDQRLMVFAPGLCDQMKEELYSIESYSLSNTSYVLTVRARDNKHTLLTLTEGKITIQGR
jgi:Tfp pilus assembly protein PilE